MLTKKKKEKDKSTIAKNLLSRYFSILSNNSLSLSPSFLHAFARRIFTVRFRPFRGQQSPKYQTTLLTYRTFNNPSLGERNANNIEQIYRRLRPCREREKREGRPKFRETGANDGPPLVLPLSLSLALPHSVRPPAHLSPSIRPALKPHHRDYRARFEIRSTPLSSDKSIGLKARFRATTAGHREFLCFSVYTNTGGSSAADSRWPRPKDYRQTEGEGECRWGARASEREREIRATDG